MKLETTFVVTGTGVRASEVETQAKSVPVCLCLANDLLNSLQRLVSNTTKQTIPLLIWLKRKQLG